MTGQTEAARRQLEEKKMIQACEGEFDRVCIDSGAGESVCPVGAFPAYGSNRTGKKVGAKYKAAGGQELVNVGEKKPHFTSNDILRAVGGSNPDHGEREPDNFGCRGMRQLH